MSPWRTPVPDARVLHPAEYDAALDVCARDAVGSVLAAARILEVTEGHTRPGELWGWGEKRGELESVCWSGANLVPVAAGERAVTSFGAIARGQGRRCSSIAGNAEETLALWREVSSAWSTPREIRADQPSMAIDTDPLVTCDDGLRPAQERDFHALLPASVAMFVEEVGYSPMLYADAYRARLTELVRAGRVYVRWVRGPGGPRLGFKCELGAVACGVAQLQGVWVDPVLRGRGLGTACVAALVRLARSEVAPTVSLYVNSYNAPAIAVYRKVGFRRVGTYATVLF